MLSRLSVLFMPANRRLALCALLIGTAGVVARFYGLGSKAYWYDETYSLLSARGEKPTALRDAFFNPGPSNAGAIAAHFREPISTSGIDTLFVLAGFDPHHSPMYYLGLHSWMKACGGWTPANGRALSATANSLALIAAVWAGTEIGGPALGLVFAIVMAVSPIQLAYAQEAREYSLWVFGLVLLYGWFARALRTNDKRDWRCYGLVAAFCLYAHPLTAPVMGFQAVAAWNLDRFSRKSFQAGWLLPVIAYSPWMLIMAIQRGFIAHAIGWLGNTVTFRDYLFNIARNWSLPFVDIGGVITRLHLDGHAVITTAFLGVVACVIAAFRLRDRTLSAVIFSGLIGVLFTLFALDAIKDGLRAMILRYNMPGVVALQLAMAAVITSLRSWRRPAALALVIAAGGWSGWRYLQSPDYWTKGGMQQRVIEKFNAGERPIVIGQTGQFEMAVHMSALALNVRPDLEFLVKRPEAPLPPGSQNRTVFLIPVEIRIPNWTVTTIPPEHSQNPPTPSP